jgi:hypothetical protein
MRISEHIYAMGGANPGDTSLLLPNHPVDCSAWIVQIDKTKLTSVQDDHPGSPVLRPGDALDKLLLQLFGVLVPSRFCILDPGFPQKTASPQEVQLRSQRATGNDTAVRVIQPGFGRLFFYRLYPSPVHTAISITKLELCFNTIIKLGLSNINVKIIVKVGRNEGGWLEE